MISLVLVFVVLALLMVLACALVRSELDVAAFLTLFLVALFGINARWIFPGAGAVGTPAMLLAAAAAWWWWMAKISPRLGVDRGLNPVRLALLFYLWFVTLNWGLTRLRSLTEIEVGGSNRTIITSIAMVGVALVITDGVSSMIRLEKLLRRVVVGGTAFSIVGILQVLGLDLVALVSFPGLVRNTEIAQSLSIRSGLSRAEGTGLHSIEYGVVLALILPFAIHYARHGPDRRTRRLYAFMTVVIAAGIPLSVSRSGLLAVTAALLVLSLAWTWRDRLLGFLSAASFMVVMGILIPGLIGTFRALIFAGSQDRSVAARLRDIPLVEERFSQAPWFGSGVGTFSPDEDFLVDNQYFVTLLESGIVGLIVVLTLFLVAILACLHVVSRSEDDATRHLAFALMAGIAVLPVAMATFDAFYFRIFLGVGFLLIGCTGALWRLAGRNLEPGDNDQEGLLGVVQ